MNNIILPALFYVIIATYAICQWKNGTFKVLFNWQNFEELKYHIGIVIFFFLNINVLFYCSFCSHCHNLCIAFVLAGVLFGAVIYLSHLCRQSINAFYLMLSAQKFDVMAPFFSVTYIVLVYNIVAATLNAGSATLHDSENKMLIVLLYPFFIVLGELTAKMKSMKSTM